MSYLQEFFDKRKKVRESKLSPEDQKKFESALIEEQRNRAIGFKKFFGDKERQEVMFDLMNRYYILKPLPRLADGKIDPVAEGQRSVVLDLLNRANVSIEQLDKILKGEF